jgi:hypothetical protein
LAKASALVGFVLVALSAFGFANALVLKMHGPGGDLGILAGILAALCFGVARSNGENWPLPPISFSPVTRPALPPFP